MSKITFVIGGMSRGGAERVISILANYYAEFGWNVDIVVLLFNKVEYKLNNKIHLIDMTMKTQNKITSAARWVLLFRNYVKRNDPDVIVSFVARINVVVLLATLGLGKKIIISERNDPAMDGRSRFLDTVTKVVYKKAKRIVFQTKRAANHFKGTILKNSVIISNPIAVECPAHDRTNNKIVAVGRLAEQKNQKMLIDAFSDVVKKYPEYKLWIYGEGTLRNQLETKIKELHLENKVFLPGNIPDIHQNIADAAMFVLSSNYEGLSNALLEAMMMGIPCISTECAGSDEYIKNGINGLLVPVGDKEKMVVAIERLIEDVALRTSIGIAGKQSVEQCDSKIVMKKWCKTIEE